MIRMRDDKDMSDITYEVNNPFSMLEKFEWDNTWLEQTENNTAKRILYIGDSISCGVRRCITTLSKNEILCDGFGTSKALDNPYLKQSIKLFMMQQGKCETILFNNGLHGWHLTKEEYENYYEEMLTFLVEFQIPIYVILTTYVTDNPEHSERVKIRNDIAKLLAKKYNLPIIDLYSISVDNANLQIDGVHFDVAGYEKLAECILSEIK